MSEAKRSCERCRFWVPEEWRNRQVDPDVEDPEVVLAKLSQALGECRRYAPPAKHLPPDDPRYPVRSLAHPRLPRAVPSLTEASYWCGDFKPVEKQPAEAISEVDFDRLAPWPDFESTISTQLRNMLDRMDVRGWESLYAALARKVGEGFDPTIKTQVEDVARSQRNIGDVHSRKFIDSLRKAGWPFRD
jgi:hypothetical protein